MIKKLNPKQKTGLKMLSNDVLHTFLYGGARSGKTRLLVETIVCRALKYPNSRHLIARLHYNHAKLSIWYDTLTLVLKDLPNEIFNKQRQELLVQFSNGSEIWIDGLDNPERIDKVLGREYSTIYLNEISQMGFDIVTTVRTRLAQKVENCINKYYYDCNPPSPLHWCYIEFIRGINPKTGEPIKKELYQYLQMNPIDNKENLPPNYIENTLDQLPERQRKRFKDGEFVKSEGAIYEKFNSETMVMPRDQLPQFEEVVTGVDFGLNSTGVKIGFAGESVYIIADTGGYNITASILNQRMKSTFQGWSWAYCDPSGGERIQEIAGGQKANNSVEPGINYINQKIERGEFFVCEDAVGVLSEIGDYRRDELGRIIKENDHYMDAMRYGIFTHCSAVHWGVA